MLILLLFRSCSLLLLLLRLLCPLHLLVADAPALRVLFGFKECPVCVLDQLHNVVVFPLVGEGYADGTLEFLAVSYDGLDLVDDVAAAPPDKDLVGDLVHEY